MTARYMKDRHIHLLTRQASEKLAQIPHLFTDWASTEQCGTHTLFLVHLQVNSLHTGMQSFKQDHILCAFQISGPSLDLNSLGIFYAFSLYDKISVSLYKSTLPP